MYQWKHCESPTFENVKELYVHCKTHIERLDTSEIAPINRQYCCHWKDCSKHYSKLKLLENHLREHTNNLQDSFLEVLLCDQVTAINTCMMICEKVVDLSCQVVEHFRTTKIFVPQRQDGKQNQRRIRQNETTKAC